MTMTRITGWFVLAVTAAWIAVGLLKGWGLGLDFANFYDAGQKARAGEFSLLYNPFAPIAGQPPLGNMTFYSAPITAWLYAPMAALSPRAAMLVFKAAGTLVLILSIALLYRGLRPLSPRDGTDRDRFFLLFALAALFFQPFWTIYRVGGQTTPFVLAFLVVGMLAAIAGRSASAALLCAAAVLIKPVLAPAAILIFLLSDNRFRVTALIAGVLSLGLSLWLFGTDLHAQFLDLLGDETRKLLIPTLNSAPFSFLEPLIVGAGAYPQGGDAPKALVTTLTVLRLAAAACLISGLLGLLRQGLPHKTRTWVVWTGGLLLALTLSPVVWAHYLGFAFPALALLIALWTQWSGPVRAHLGLIIGLSLFQHRMIIEQLERMLGTDTTAALTAIGFLKSLPLLLLLVFLALWRRPIAQAIRDIRWQEE